MKAENFTVDGMLKEAYRQREEMQMRGEDPLKQELVVYLGYVQWFAIQDTLRTGYICQASFGDPSISMVAPTVDGVKIYRVIAESHYNLTLADK